jgi:hypothetical protein
MAHDSQLARRENEPNETNKQSKTHSDIVADWLIVFGDMYRADVTEAMGLLYREALKEIKPEILHKAFVRVTKTSKFLPTPAEVLEAANIELELLQPPKTNYEQIPLEEREAALEETKEYREALRKFLHKKDPPRENPAANKLSENWVGMTPEEDAATQKAYVRYLEEEAAKDEYNKAHDIPPIPRSHEEQRAIWWHRSRQERARLRKQVRRLG